MSTPILDKIEEVKFWIEKDILLCRFNKPDFYISVDNAKTYLSKIEQLTEDKPMPIVVDIRKFVGNFSPIAAKLFAESPILKNILLHTFVADTLNGKLLIASYSRIYLKDADVHVFSNMDAALAYCTESLNKLHAN